MKQLILLTSLFILLSCSEQTEKTKKPSKAAIELNNQAARLMMKHNDKAMDSAHKFLDSAITLDPDYFVAYSNKVAVFCRQGNFSKAVETAKQLERIQPENPEAIFTLGFLLEKTGDIDAANKKYKEALAINEEKLKYLDSIGQSYLSVQTNYALNLIFANKEKEGRRELSAVLQKDPNNLPAKILYSRTRTEIFRQLTNQN